jgi:4-amino-4-deoxy-L-arabinose transferase-like glycosyltransferase
MLQAFRVRDSYCIEVLLATKIITNMTPKQKWLLAGILLLAIFFRYYQIMSLPGGLFPDEAANGLDINRMYNGDLQPFYESNNGREALFFYMLWGSVELFGRGPWQHHIVSALVGVLSVLGCFLVTRIMFRYFRKDDDPKGVERATNLSLWATFFMSVSAWHIVLSRTAFRANLIPLFTSFTFYFLILAIEATTKSKRYLWSVLTGATFALGFYSYIAYRIMVPLVAVAVLWPLLVDIIKSPRLQGIKKFFGPALAAGAAAIVFIAPLAYYFHTHPGSFIGRSNQVSIFNPDLNHGHLFQTLLQVSWESMRAYFYHGDMNWRHNVSGEAFLSIIISPFFALGLIGVVALAIRYMFTPIKNKMDWKYFLLTGWFFAMLIPVVTTAEGIPHGLRAIGTIPPVFIITAVGLMWVVGWSAKFVNKFWEFIPPWKQRVLSIAFHIKTIAFIIALILHAYILYFVYAANTPENYYAFRSDLTPVSQYLNEFGDKNNTYLVLDKFSIMTVEYLTTEKGQPYKQVDPEDSWKLTGLKTGDKLIFAQSSIFDVKKFREYHPDAVVKLDQRDKFNQTVMAVFEIK